VRAVQEQRCGVQARPVPREARSRGGWSPSENCPLSYSPHRGSAPNRGDGAGAGRRGLRPQSCTADRPHAPAEVIHPLPTSTDQPRQITNVLISDKGLWHGLPAGHPAIYQGN
jgi:hypothetical protein